MSLPSFSRPRKSLLETVLERMRGTNPGAVSTPPFVEPQEMDIPRDLPPQIPDDPMPLKRPSLTANPTAGIPRPPLRSEEMQGQLNTMNQPLTRKQSLLQGLTQAAPIALGGLFGGSVGASGAASGVDAYTAEQGKLREGRRKTLTEQIEAQKNRELTMQGHELTAGTAQSKLQQDMQQYEETNRRITSEGAANRDAEMAREQFRLKNTPHNIDPLSPQGVDAAVQRTERESKISPRPTALPSLLPPDVEAQRVRIAQESRPPKQDTSVSPFEAWQRQNPGRPVEDFLKASNPKLQDGGPSAYSKERADRTIQDVDALMSQVGRTTTGFGSLLSSMPESGARNFKAQLDTLKANIAFNELTAMREASKTGGALGAISERELTLLTSALGALDQGQSPDDFKKQLAKIKESVQRWQQSVAQKPNANPSGAPIVQRNKRTGATRYSTDGGKTWVNGQPPQ